MAGETGIDFAAVPIYGYGTTAGTPAPSGGRIENGLFVDNAMNLIEPKVPAPTAAEADAALGDRFGAVQRFRLGGSGHGDAHAVDARGFAEHDLRAFRFALIHERQDFIPVLARDERPHVDAVLVAGQHGLAVGT